MMLFDALPETEANWKIKTGGVSYGTLGILHTAFREGDVQIYYFVLTFI